MTEITYKRNYLNEVIARIDFVSPIHKLNHELPSKLSERALKNFPILEPKQGIAAEFQLSPKITEHKNIEFTEWNFYGKEREKRLVIYNNAVYMVYNVYPKYELFRNDFVEIIEVLFTEIPEVVANRLGLRYINNFEIPNGDPFKWDEYINEYLISSLRFVQDKNLISRAFNNLEYNFEDFNLRFQFGMPNSDYPAPIRKKHFVLDYDAYHQGLQTMQEIPSNLDRYHTKIQSLFETGITDKLRGLLNA